MTSITFAVDENLKKEISQFSWLNLSELVKLELLRRQAIINKLNSKEERELLSWSIDLGRKSKKGRFNKLLSSLSPQEREELLSKKRQNERNSIR
jgi:hypothetical protein